MHIYKIENSTNNIVSEYLLCHGKRKNVVYNDFLEDMVIQNGGDDVTCNPLILCVLRAHYLVRSRTLLFTLLITLKMPLKITRKETLLYSNEL